MPYEEIFKAKLTAELSGLDTATQQLNALKTAATEAKSALEALNGIQITLDFSQAAKELAAFSQTITGSVRTATTEVRDTVQGLADEVVNRSIIPEMIKKIKQEFDSLPDKTAPAVRALKDEFKELSTETNRLFKDVNTRATDAIKPLNQMQQALIAAGNDAAKMQSILSSKSFVDNARAAAVASGESATKIMDLFNRAAQMQTKLVDVGAQQRIAQTMERISQMAQKAGETVEKYGTNVANAATKAIEANTRQEESARRLAQANEEVSRREQIAARLANETVTEGLAKRQIVAQAAVGAARSIADAQRVASEAQANATLLVAQAAEKARLAMEGWEYAQRQIAAAQANNTRITVNFADAAQNLATTRQREADEAARVAAAAQREATAKQQAAEASKRHATEVLSESDALEKSAAASKNATEQQELLTQEIGETTTKLREQLIAIGELSRKSGLAALKSDWADFRQGIRLATSEGGNFAVGMRQALFGVNQSSNVFARTLDWIANRTLSTSEVTNRYAAAIERLTGDAATETRYLADMSSQVVNLGKVLEVPPNIAARFTGALTEARKEWEKLFSSIEAKGEPTRQQLQMTLLRTEALKNELKAYRVAVGEDAIRSNKDLAETFDYLGKAIERQQQRARAAMSNIQAYTAEQKKLDTQQKSTSQSAEKSLSIFQRIAQIFSGLGSSARKASTDVQSISTATKNLETSTRTASSGVSFLNASFGSMARFTGIIFGITSAVYALANAVRGAITEFMSVNNTVQNFRVTLTNMLRGTAIDAEKAFESSMAFIKQVVARTPFEMQDAIEVFQRMLIVGLDPKQWFEPVANAAAAMNKPMEQLTGALQRLIVGDTGQAIMMMRDFGINVNSAGAYLDKTTGKVLNYDDALAASKMSTEEMNAANIEFAKLEFENGKLVTETGKALNILNGYFQQNATFAGAAEARSKTLSGVMSNLKDTIAGLFIAAGQPIFDKLAQKGSELLVTIGKLLPALEATARAIGTTVANAIDFVTNIGENAQRVLSGLATFISTTLVSDISAGLTEIPNVFSEAVGWLSDIWDDLVNAASTWGWNFIVEVANGIYDAASDVLTEALNYAADLIASFFEGQSPPPEGPLSTIDEWGAKLMETLGASILEIDTSTYEEATRDIERVFNEAGYASAEAFMNAFRAINQSDALAAIRSAITDMKSVLSSINIDVDPLLTSIKTEDFGEMKTVLEPLKTFFKESMGEQGLEPFEKSRDLMVSLIATINETGQVNEETFSQLSQLIGEENKNISDNIRAYLELQAAEARLLKLQQPIVDAEKEAAAATQRVLELQAQMATATATGGDTMGIEEQLILAEEDLALKQQNVEAAKTQQAAAISQAQAEVAAKQEAYDWSKAMQDFYNDSASLQEQFIKSMNDAAKSIGDAAKSAAKAGQKMTKDIEGEYASQKAALQWKYDQGIISEEEYVAGMLRIEEQYVDDARETGIASGLDDNIQRIKDLQTQLDDLKTKAKNADDQVRGIKAPTISEMFADWDLGTSGEGQKTVTAIVGQFAGRIAGGMRDATPGIIDIVAQKIREGWPKVGDALSEWGTNFWGWLVGTSTGPTMAGAGTTTGGAISKIPTVLGQVGKAMGEAWGTTIAPFLAGWAGSFWVWLVGADTGAPGMASPGGRTGGAIAKAGEMLGKIGTALATAWTTDLWPKISEWPTKFWVWLVGENGTGGALAFVAEKVGAVGQAIADAWEENIAPKLLTWADLFWAWLNGDKGATSPDIIKPQMSTVGTRMAQEWPTIQTELEATWGPDFWNWMGSIGAIPEEYAQKVADSFKDPNLRAKLQEEAYNAGYSSGDDLVSGVVAGINAVFGKKEPSPVGPAWYENLFPGEVQIIQLAKDYVAGVKQRAYDLYYGLGIDLAGGFVAGELAGIFSAEHIAEAGKRIGEWATNLYTTTLTTIQTMDWGTVAVNIILGIISPFQTGIIPQPVKEAISTWFNNLIGEIKKFLGIKSPSTLAEEQIGVPFRDGIVSVFGLAIPQAILDTITTFKDNLIAGFKSIFGIGDDGSASVFSTIGGAIVNGIQSGIGLALAAVGGVVGLLSGIFSGGKTEADTAPSLSLTGISVDFDAEAAKIEARLLALSAYLTDKLIVMETAWTTFGTNIVLAWGGNMFSIEVRLGSFEITFGLALFNMKTRWTTFNTDLVTIWGTSITELKTKATEFKDHVTGVINTLKTKLNELIAKMVGEKDSVKAAFEDLNDTKFDDLEEELDDIIQKFKDMKTAAEDAANAAKEANGAGQGGGTTTTPPPTPWAPPAQSGLWNTGAGGVWQLHSNEMVLPSTVASAWRGLLTTLNNSGIGTRSFDLPLMAPGVLVNTPALAGAAAGAGAAGGPTFYTTINSDMDQALFESRVMNAVRKGNRYG